MLACIRYVLSRQHWNLLCKPVTLAEPTEEYRSALQGVNLTSEHVVGIVSKGVKCCLQWLRALLAADLSHIQKPLSSILPCEASVVSCSHGLGIMAQGVRQLLAEVLWGPDPKAKACVGMRLFVLMRTDLLAALLTSLDCLESQNGWSLKGDRHNDKPNPSC